MQKEATELQNQHLQNLSGKNYSNYFMKLWFYTYFITQDGQESKPVNIVRVSGWDVRANSGIPVNNLVQMWMETERSKSGDITLLVCQ